MTEAEELTRAASAVPVAILAPLAIPRLRGDALRSAGWAAAVMLLALAPGLGSWRAWVVVIAAALVAAASAGLGAGRWPASAVAAGVMLAVAAAVYPDAAGNALSGLGGSDVVVTAAGAFTCIFLGGAVIGRVMHPFAQRIRSEDSVPQLENAGRIIGWLERALLFGLLLAGAPNAAALVLAGKSLARFPSFTEEHFAEYYLIGSLMSLLIAAACALAVRAALGLTPLVPNG